LPGQATVVGEAAAHMPGTNTNNGGKRLVQALIRDTPNNGQNNACFRYFYQLILQKAS
jgi:hypothetical protein